MGRYLKDRRQQDTEDGKRIDTEDAPNPEGDRQRYVTRGRRLQPLQRCHQHEARMNEEEKNAKSA
jgi:hypothetical protein